MVYSTKSIIRTALSRCHRKRMELTLPEFQLVLYLIQNYFVQHFGDTCFAEPFYVWEGGPYLESILDWCDDKSPIPYRKFMSLARKDPKMEQEYMDEVKNIVDIISGVPKERLLETIKGQRPFKRALARKSQEVLIEDVQEFFRVKK